MATPDGTHTLLSLSSPGGELPRVSLPWLPFRGLLGICASAQQLCLHLALGQGLMHKAPH